MSEEQEARAALAEFNGNVVAIHQAIVDLQKCVLFSCFKQTQNAENALLSTNTMHEVLTKKETF